MHTISPQLVAACLRDHLADAGRVEGVGHEGLDQVAEVEEEQREGHAAADRRNDADERQQELERGRARELEGARRGSDCE